MKGLIFKMVEGKVMAVHFIGTTRTHIKELKKDVLKYVENGKLNLEEGELYYVDENDFCEVIANDVDSETEICCMIDGVEYALICIDTD